MINTRLAKAADIPYLKKTWLYSLYNGNSDYQRVEKDVFMRNYSKIIDKIMTNPEVFVRIACLEEDHDVIISFSVTQGSALHYIHTKKAWRGQKYHWAIVPEGIDTYTHITRQFLKIKPKNLKYNPFLIG